MYRQMQLRDFFSYTENSFCERNQTKEHSLQVLVESDQQNDLVNLLHFSISFWLNGRFIFVFLFWRRLKQDY